MKRLIVLLALLTMPTFAMAQEVVINTNPTIEMSARRHVRSCDGVHGCICGAVQMAYYGIRDNTYKLARKWLDFPRTSLQPGAVVVSSRGGRGKGHVARIEQVIDNCTAVVTDEKGTYTRNICKRRLGIVMPQAGGSVNLSARQNYSSAIIQYQPMNNY